MPLWKLYLVFCEIGAVTFGGGYAMLPLFQDELVTQTGLISAPDFTAMAALAQLTPGAIGLNMATYIGWNLHGLPGALACTAGLLTPPLLLVTAIAYCFARLLDNPWAKRVLGGVRPAMLGLIAAAALFFLENSVFTGPLPLDRWLPWRAPAAPDAASAPASNMEWGVDWRGAVIFAVALAAGKRLGTPLVLLLAGALGVALYWLAG